MINTVPVHNWIGKRRVITAVIIGLFLFISLSTVLIGYHQYQSSLVNTLNSDKTSVGIFSELLREHEIATRGILESYASRSLFVAAVKRRDRNAVHGHLEDLKKNNNDMDLTFLTDKSGVIWANYPDFPEALGKNVSDRDWYKGISRDWKPYTSVVFKLIVGDKPLAVAVCVPIFDEKRNVIGVLANSHRLSFIGHILDRIRMDKKMNLTVIDQTGSIIHSRKYPHGDQIVPYPLYQNIKQTIMEKRAQFETDGPDNRQDKIYITISQINGLGWTVIAERSSSDTLQSQYGYFMSASVVATLLFLIIAGFILFQHTIQRKTSALLKASLDLEHCESRFKGMVDTVSGIIYTCSDKKAGMYYSHQAQSLLGYSSQYLIDHPTLWNDSIHPDDLPAVDQAINNARPSQQIEIVYRILDAHGKWHWFSDRFISVTNEDGEKIITGLATDITERKQLEAKLQQKMDMLARTESIAHIGSWEWEVAADTVTWSDELFNIFDLNPADGAPSFAGQTHLYHPDDLVLLKEAADAAINNGTPFVLEMRAIRNDGESRICAARGYAMMNPEGKATHLFGSFQDITERKKLREEAEKARNLESLSILAGGIAHDLNNILQSLVASLYLAKRFTPETSEAFLSLEEAEVSLETASSLAVKLIAFGKGSLIFKELIEPAAFIRTTLKAALCESNIITILNIPDDLLSIPADAGRLAQAIEYIAINAREAMPSGGALLVSAANVTLSPQEVSNLAPGKYILITIKDEGGGIDPDLLPKIFDPYFSTKNRDSQKGMGLGLAISYAIIKQHDGLITAASELGNGAVFTIYLPAC